MFETNNFDSIKIGIASPEKIREWSYGEVTKPETINYRTQKPEPDGLFCQKIFGPIKDWECACGKYKRVKHKGVICDRCGVKVEQSKVRRERMGHINLAAPVAHLWYFKNTPSIIATVLGMPPKEVEHVIYYASYVVLDPGELKDILKEKDVISDDQYRELLDKYGNVFTVGMGAESIKTLLQRVDVDAEVERLQTEILEDQAKNDKKDNAQAPKRMQNAKRLEFLQAFKQTGSKPEWMILEALPVLPPDLRPMVPLDGGRYATSDLNDLYRFVISRNKRLAHFLSTGGVDSMIRNEKRMLQVAVDNLIDNSKRAKSSTSGKSHELKSLTSILKGKQGRFRQNLLGKRVDYSGRSVIVVGPELKLYQCGLPKEMALELFKPFVMKELVDKNICNNIKSAKRYVERARSEVWDVLEDIIKDHPVLLNRAPTLHRLGIQAFEPVLVEGRAIKLHPLVCAPFNADFDGDQMAVHVPLSIEAQAEARFLMLATNNILKLSDGQPVICPSQDMVLGCYYLTVIKPGAKGEGKCFISPDEAKIAYAQGIITLQTQIRVRLTKEIDGVEKSGIVETSLGRLIFNEAIPQDIYDYVKVSTGEFEPRINRVVKKKDLQMIVEKCFKHKGASETAVVLDNIKALGFKYSTISGLTASVFDMHIPTEKAELIADAEKKVNKLEKLYERGHITDTERYNSVINVWSAILGDMDKAIDKAWDDFNPIKMIKDSGARGNKDQIRQLSGMRGLMQDPTGKTIELPVKSNLREGLTALEYFLSSHGGRKGLADTALKTAQSGYLTRRLVDVAQSVIIREDDCGDTTGIEATAIVKELAHSGEINIIETLKDRIIGRYTVGEVINPNTGKVIVPASTMISEEAAAEIEEAGIKSVRIRSVFSCKCADGLCSKCYGKNMANGDPVKTGEAVGVIAAQSIGEPGTQLTMRTFHTGGVATGEDITQGLPRVEELFDARPPKAEAIIAGIAGKIGIQEKNKKRIITVKNGDVELSYTPAPTARILVTDGQEVSAGTPITQGSINLQDLLRTRGAKGVQDYIICEVKMAYQSAGVAINDKHLEIIIRQMLRKVRIEKVGDSSYLPGQLVELTEAQRVNAELSSEGKTPATIKRALLGIAKASLASESFLSAASFQETTRVLTEAVIKGKVDHLVGLKENVILGKRIPAGTGLKIYNGVGVQPTFVDSNAVDETPFAD